MKGNWTLAESLPAIAGQFSMTVNSIDPLGNGLINDTYLVATDLSPFVLQRINRQVFPEPSRVMANLDKLNRYVCEHQERDTLRLPEILPTNSGEIYYRDGNADIWRAMSYFDDTESLEQIRDNDDAAKVGEALGLFHRSFSGLNTTLLVDTLPGFHNTPDYLSRYQETVIHASGLAQSNESMFCIEFIKSHQCLAFPLEEARQQGRIRLKVAHGDPKLNNFLFDVNTREIVSLIDLDTVKPGLWLHDLGDCVRSCCRHGLDGRFNIEAAHALLSGYVSKTADLLDDADYQNMYTAICLLPFELGLRFFTDHLDGDRYFKITRAGQNLERAVDQFRLCASIEEHQQELIEIIETFRLRFS